MTLAQYLAFEMNFEPAAGLILKNAGFTVVSPFMPGTGVDPDLAVMPDQCCIVTFEPDAISGDIRAFQLSSQRDLVSMAAGGRGKLKVFHRVPVGDLPTKVGQDPVCYKQLCIQRGQIRALFLTSENPFTVALPDYDILSINLAAPDRRAEPDRSANSATEIFDIVFCPTNTLNNS